MNPEPETRGPSALMVLREVCVSLGGSRPIDPSTLYRGVRAGRYPAPIKIGPGSSRWLRAEVEAALAAMREARR
jgi:predicted DNA-binding transcriptional regulator AlpA